MYMIYVLDDKGMLEETDHICYSSFERAEEALKDYNDTGQYVWDNTVVILQVWRY